MADDSEEYGTVAWFWKYEPEASEVMFRAGREAERADALAHALRTTKRLAAGPALPDQLMRQTLAAFANELLDKLHVGAAEKEGK